MITSKIEQVLHFPEGSFFITKGAPYFYPGTGDKAYIAYGQRNELFGKICHQLKSASGQLYDLTYEFEDDALISARLLTGNSRSKGRMANREEVEALNEKLQNGTLELKTPQKPPSITRAAKFGDGRVLLLVENLEKDSRHVLFVGTPGNLQKIKLTNGVQGGCSFYFKAENGKRLALPYGLGGPTQESPQYGDEFLGYIDVKNPEDLSAFGLNAPPTAPHLDPFFNPSQPPKTPAGSAKNQFRR